jgi:hypothetical protein
MSITTVVSDNINSSSLSLTHQVVVEQPIEVWSEVAVDIESDLPGNNRPCIGASWTAISLSLSVACRYW